LENDSPDAAAAAPSRTRWQRHVIEPIAVQLTQGITPEKIALTLAVGSALALFPILGTTTLLCILAGVLLKLNQPIIQLVNALCTPLHFAVIFLEWELGRWLFGGPPIPNPGANLNHLLWGTPTQFLERFGMGALHAIGAWAVTAPLWTLLIYMGALPILREALRRRAILAAPTEAQPPVHPIP
jgi:uncharacterized protein (DUF2062 family)